MPELVCWKCGVSLAEVPQPIKRSSNCLACYAELHCCRMCESYDTRYISKCSDERAESVADKEKANFCEWFRPRPHAFAEQEHVEGKAAEARLKALFGEETDDKNPSSGDTPPSELEDLFRRDD